MGRTRVKICCIQDPDEAALAISLGADALGLVGPMPTGKGLIDDAMAHTVAARIPPPVSVFLLTSETTAEGIAAHVQRVGADTVQIVDHIDPRQSARLARLIPDIRRVQVLHVEDMGVLDLIDDYAPHVHAFLLDSGTVSGPERTLGGTGQTHDWSISGVFVEKSPLPVFLAGGLRPDNVATAIEVVRPFGVDLCTGVRTNGVLDRDKLTAFMAAVSGRGGHPPPLKLSTR
ncbi:MAG: phosphoribosylanthranilate isomerase [Myxococcota bacterium]